MKEVPYKRVTKILVAVSKDFSKQDKIALKTAARWAQFFRAKLFVLVVLKRSLRVQRLLRALPIKQNLLLREGTSIKRSLISLKNYLKALKNNVRAIEIIIHVGEPFMEVLNFAKVRRIDLIIIGYGRQRKGEMLMGSIAEHIVQKALCDVLIVRDGV